MSTDAETKIFHGGCHCGALRVEFGTAMRADEIVPRACDCSFCTKHAAAYVSDPNGTLSIAAITTGAARVYRQGSNNAAFLTCRHCGVLVAVVCVNDARVFGAVNARCLDAAEFGEPVAASPQRLDAEEKMARWSKLWTADVVLTRVDLI